MFQISGTATVKLNKAFLHFLATSDDILNFDKKKEKKILLQLAFNTFFNSPETRISTFGYQKTQNIISFTSQT